MTPVIYHFPPQVPRNFLIWSFDRQNFCTLIEI